MYSKGFLTIRSKTKIFAYKCNCSSKIFSEVMYFNSGCDSLSQLETLDIGNIHCNQLSDRNQLYVKIILIIANCSAHRGI